jgi:YbgC/YbaW family acyl-CoA thioester hydrolase
MEALGYGFVVVEALVRYRGAAFFDDELTIRTGLAELGRASILFEYTALRDGRTISTCHTRHAYVDLATGKARRTPKELLGLASGSPQGGVA